MDLKPFRVEGSRMQRLQTKHDRLTKPRIIARIPDQRGKVDRTRRKCATRLCKSASAQAATGARSRGSSPARLKTSCTTARGAWYPLNCSDSLAGLRRMACHRARMLQKIHLPPQRQRCRGSGACLLFFLMAVTMAEQGPAEQCQIFMCNRWLNLCHWST